MTDSVQGDTDSHVKWHRWPYVVFVVAMLAALYLVIFWLPEPRLTLDYLKALIWPGVVAVGLYWLREPLREKMAQLLKIGALGVEAQFANQQLQEGATGPAATVLTDVEDSESEGPDTEPDVSPVADEAPSAGHLTVTHQSHGVADEGKPEPIRSGSGIKMTAEQRLIVQQRREVKRVHEQQAIEDIMRVGAWWGFDMAQLGFKTRPTPVVEWTPDGRPLIQYAKGEPGWLASATQSERERWQRLANQPLGAQQSRMVMRIKLEQEIRDLEAPRNYSENTLKNIASLGTKWDPLSRSDRARLLELKSALRAIDPDSPLGIE